MTDIPHDAWILVGDGEKALFFRNEGDEEHPNFEVLRILEHDNPPTREQGTDTPGRFNDGPSIQRSAVEETDWHRLEKERFATEIADKLYEFGHRNAYSSLIVVAPPLVMGKLRKSFHREVADRVIAEINKTLTNHPVDRMEEVIAGS
jgi:protein required for attachment to host cells